MNADGRGVRLLNQLPTHMHLLGDMMETSALLVASRYRYILIYKTEVWVERRFPASIRVNDDARCVFFSWLPNRCGNLPPRHNKAPLHGHYAMGMNASEKPDITNNISCKCGLFWRKEQWKDARNERKIYIIAMLRNPQMLFGKTTEKELTYIPHFGFQCF